MKQKIYSYILFAAILIMISGKMFSQGVGNHVTMSLENCSQPAANIIQFDLMVVSDGASGSDLRPNSFQYGVNFDTCILQAGDTVVPSYVTNSSDFVGTNFSLNSPGFIHSPFLSHIRITQPPFSGGNTGQTMTLNHKYRFGTFRLASTHSFTNFCPNFTLQDTAAASHTSTCGIVWIGGTSSTLAFCQTGTGDGYRILHVNCTTCNCTNGIDENNASLLINFFPNPATNTLTLMLPENNSKAEIKIINLLGEVKHSSTVNEQRITIDVSALSNGVYILETTVGNTVGRNKFVVNRFKPN